MGGGWEKIEALRQAQDKLQARPEGMRPINLKCYFRGMENEKKQPEDYAYRCYCLAEAFFISTYDVGRKGFEYLGGQGKIYKTEAMKTDPNLAKKREHGKSLLHVAFVNEAFSLELLFKTMNSLGLGKKQDGHKLHKLFEGLYPETQAKLINHFDRIMNTHPAAKRIVNTKLQIGISHESISFHAALKASSECYNKMRYSFEKNTKDLDTEAGLTAYVFAARAVVLEDQPTWPSIIPEFP